MVLLVPEQLVAGIREPRVRRIRAGVDCLEPSLRVEDALPQVRDRCDIRGPVLGEGIGWTLSDLCGHIE